MPCGVVKTELYESRRKNWGKVLLFEKDAFLSISDNGRETLALFFHFFFDAVVETAFYVSKGTLRGKRFFSGKKCIFQSIWETETNFSNLCQKFYGRLIKSALYVSQQTVREISFLRKLCFVDLGPWAKSFRHSV